MKYVLYVLCVFTIFSLSASPVIVFENPREGFSSSRIQIVKGNISGFAGDRAIAIINGVPQTVPLNGGLFSFSMVPSPGLNLIEMQAGSVKKAVSFYAQVPKRDIKILLVWDTPTDVDLWVIDPNGERCYYAANSTSSGGNLDVDVTTGYGPETFTMASAVPGTYSVQCQYYSSQDSPVTRGKVYIILFEGSSKESRKDFSFVMTKQCDVFDIGSFIIDGE